MQTAFALSESLPPRDPRHVSGMAGHSYAGARISTKYGHLGHIVGNDDHVAVDVDVADLADDLRSSSTGDH